MNRAKISFKTISSLANPLLAQPFLCLHLKDKRPSGSELFFATFECAHDSVLAVQNSPPVLCALAKRKRMWPNLNVSIFLWSFRLRDGIAGTRKVQFRVVRNGFRARILAGADRSIGRGF